MSDTTNIRRVPVALALAAVCAGAPAAAQAQATPRADPHAQHHAPATPYGIPASIRAEHREIHEALEAATRAPGRVGAAARELAAVLHPHFQREEQVALPPLALLAPLARGEALPAMRAVLPMTDSLRAELPRMLREHEAIHAATARLGEVARAEGDVAVARLADELARHAQQEEELLYPAAVLVGDLVRARVPHD